MYRNLIQVIYNLTGALMPRDLHRYDAVLPELLHYGITRKKFQTPLLLCMDILGTARQHENSTYIDFAALEQSICSDNAEAASEASEQQDRTSGLSD